MADKLVQALRHGGYRQWSYSSVPDGFALVTQMEQIKPDGAPTPEPGRWSTNVPSVRDLTLLEFIRALASSPSGHYRIIAFIVTNKPWPHTGAAPSSPQAERWLAEGLNRLPSSIGTLAYAVDYATTALVYEFRKTSGSEAEFVRSSDTRAEDHLTKAGIAGSLSGMR